MPEPSSFRVRSLSTSVYLPTFLFAVGQGATLPILPLLALSLGASVPAAGAIVALRGIGTFMFDVPAGLIVARLGERKGMAIGTVILAVVGVGIAMRPSLPLYAVLVGIMGWGWALWLLSRMSYATEISPPEFRGRVMSMLGGVNRVGNFVGPIIGGTAVAIYGLEAAFVTQAVVALAALVALALFTAETPRRAEVTVRASLGRMRDSFTGRRRLLVSGGAVSIILQLIRTSRDTLIPLWGGHIGVAASGISFVFAAGSAIDMLLFYPVGQLMDRFGRKWAGVPAMALMATALAVMTQASTLTGLVLAGVLFGFGNGFGAGLGMTLASDLSPRVGRNEFLGGWRLVSDIGGITGPLTVAAVTSVASLAAACLAIGGIGFVGASVFLWIFPETMPMSEGPASDP
jgi:MFS family permease